MSKIIILSLFFLSGSFFQDTKVTFVISIPSNYTSLTSDNLGNIYLTKGDVLEKYDSEGKFQKNLSNKALGNITFVDAQNPLKLLLYYRSFQQIVLIDNMLAPSGNSISLDALGYSQATLVCTSHNNGIWIYTPQNAELIRFDQQLNKVVQTGNITQLTGSKVLPNFMTEQNNQLFLNDTATGILVFDIYGTYARTIPLKGLSHFQVNNEKIFYLKDGKLKSYDLRTLEEQELSLPAGEVLDVRTEKEKLYLLKQKSLDIYSVIK